LTFYKNNFEARKENSYFQITEKLGFLYQIGLGLLSAGKNEEFLAFNDLLWDQDAPASTVFEIPKEQYLLFESHEIAQKIGEIGDITLVNEFFIGLDKISPGQAPYLLLSCIQGFTRKGHRDQTDKSTYNFIKEKAKALRISEADRYGYTALGYGQAGNLAGCKKVLRFLIAHELTEPAAQRAEEIFNSLRVSTYYEYVSNFEVELRSALELKADSYFFQQGFNEISLNLDKLSITSSSRLTR
jgi:hypothetical protein